jgi:hypothetical protein
VFALTAIDHAFADDADVEVLRERITRGYAAVHP